MDQVQQKLRTDYLERCITHSPTSLLHGSNLDVKKWVEKSLKIENVKRRIPIIECYEDRWIFTKHIEKREFD